MDPDPMQACDRVPPTAQAKRLWCSVPTSVLPAIKAARARYGIASPSAVAIDATAAVDHPKSRADAEDEATHMPARRRRLAKGDLSVRLHKYERDGLWKFDSHVTLPFTPNWPSSALKAVRSDDASPVFFVGKLQPHDAESTVWITRDTVRLCIHGNVPDCGHVWKAERFEDECTVLAGKYAFDLGAQSERGTVIVLRCCLGLSGRARRVNLYKIPLVLQLVRNHRADCDSAVEVGPSNSRKSVVCAWLVDAVSALQRGDAPPVAPSAVYEQNSPFHHRVSIDRRIESVRQMQTEPGAKDRDACNVAAQVFKHWQKLELADRDALHLPTWWIGFVGRRSKEAEQRSAEARFRSLSTAQRVEVVVRSMQKRPFSPAEKTAKQDREETHDGSPVHFHVYRFIASALEACEESIPADYVPFAQACPGFAAALNGRRFTRLSAQLGNDACMQRHLDVLCSTWPCEHCYDGPRNGDAFTLQLTVGHTTASKTLNALKFVMEVQRANWLGFDQKIRLCSNEDTAPVKDAQYRFTLTHAQKQQLLRLPWFKFDLEVKARALCKDVDTALDADSLACLSNGAKLREGKLAVLLSRVDWNRALSKEQQYMVMLGNHASCWSAFAGQYGPGLKERVRYWLKNTSTGKKLAKEIACVVGIAVDNMWNSHDIDHIWVRANHGDIADCVGNFAICPRVLNNSDEFKHDSPEKHHYYGSKTWEQVKMLFKLYEAWKVTAKGASFNPNSVCDLADYASVPPEKAKRALQGSQITEYFKRVPVNV